MRTRKLGNSELELTVVGLGTWAIGGPWQFGWGPQDDKDSITTICQAIENGVNWIDTAAIYGCGHSEEVIGKVLKELNSRPVIATKCGLVWDDRMRKQNNLKKESIMRECEASLKRLSLRCFLLTFSFFFVL